MTTGGFKYVKYLGRGLAFCSGILAGFQIRKTSFYSPMKDEFEDMEQNHRQNEDKLKRTDKEKGRKNFGK